MPRIMYKIYERSGGMSARALFFPPVRLCYHHLSAPLFFSNRFFLLGSFLSPTRRTPKICLWIGDESCESDACLHAPEGPPCPPGPRLGAPPSSIEKHFVLPPILYAVHSFLHSHSQSFLRSFPLVPTPVFYIVPVPLQW